ncbi:hypothetical protein R1flu_018008 [Riccia fluitans]|uniref:Uncharacterized protein n=1 Tax=Riccia fluitans TaxID=41844 RepID=A0ABD1ZFX2_9MARC
MGLYQKIRWEITNARSVIIRVHSSPRSPNFLLDFGETKAAAALDFTNDRLKAAAGAAVVYLCASPCMPVVWLW